ncbi:MAG TPA: acyl carrier protein [Candidatus Methylomirabilis sp.]|nr:acyl carrier protein [Candidatus Methylomirabilis sp.]
MADLIDLGDEASLLDAGVIDSVGILELLAFLEQTFGIRISDEELSPEHFDSVEALVRFVEAKR